MSNLGVMEETLLSNTSVIDLRNCWREIKQPETTTCIVSLETYKMNEMYQNFCIWMFSVLFFIYALFLSIPAHSVR